VLILGGSKPGPRVSAMERRTRVRVMSALPAKSRHRLRVLECPLCAKSGHSIMSARQKKERALTAAGGPTNYIQPRPWSEAGRRSGAVHGELGAIGIQRER
jgi:hypothetical protein